MRFCPFCAQENTDEASECAHCGRRLPQLTARAAPAAPSLPAATPLRRPPGRPLPRPRPVPTAPALPDAPTRSVAASAPEAAPPVPRARAGTLLGVVPKQVEPKRKDATPDAATKVESSPFDGPVQHSNPLLGASRFD